MQSSAKDGSWERTGVWAGVEVKWKWAVSIYPWPCHGSWETICNVQDDDSFQNKKQAAVFSIL